MRHQGPQGVVPGELDAVQVVGFALVPRCGRQGFDQTRYAVRTRLAREEPESAGFAKQHAYCRPGTFGRGRRGVQSDEASSGVEAFDDAVPPALGSYRLGL